MQEAQAMDRPALRRFLDEWPFCGCGNPENAAKALLRLLCLHPLYEHGADLDTWIPDDGVQYLLLYALDGAGLTEHGGVIRGAWLTPKGEAVRDALAAEQVDGFEALCDGHCIHGYDFDDESHTCVDC